MSVYPQRTPYVYPLDVPTPQAQTVTGVFDMTTVSPALDSPPGEPFNELLLNALLEYMFTFNVSMDHAFNAFLTAFSPLNIVSPDVQPPVGSSGNAQPAWTLVARSATFINAIPKIVFQCVKVPAAPCQLQISYLPLSAPLNNDPANYLFSCKTPLPISAIPTQFLQELSGSNRVIKWVWDLGATDTFSIDCAGFITEGTRPSSYPIQSRNTIPYNYYCSDPYENINTGIFIITVHQPYMPGSIFPSDFEINVWKSFPKLDTICYASLHPQVPLPGSSVATNYVV